MRGSESNTPKPNEPEKAEAILMLGLICPSCRSALAVDSATNPGDDVGCWVCGCGSRLPRAWGAVLQACYAAQEPALPPPPTPVNISDNGNAIPADTGEPLRLPTPPTDPTKPQPRKRFLPPDAAALPEITLSPPPPTRPTTNGHSHHAANNATPSLRIPPPPAAPQTSPPPAADLPPPPAKPVVYEDEPESLRRSKRSHAHDMTMALAVGGGICAIILLLFSRADLSPKSEVKIAEKSPPPAIKTPAKTDAPAKPETAAKTPPPKAATPPAADQVPPGTPVPELPPLPLVGPPSPLDTLPPGTSVESRLAASALVEALSSPDWQTLLNRVRKPELVAGPMQDHYLANPYAPQTIHKFLQATKEEIGANLIIHWQVEMKTAPGAPAQIRLADIERTPYGYLLDWEKWMKTGK